MEKVILAIIIWYIALNFIAPFMVINDKYRAKKGKWRISEASLITAALLGGAFGEYLAMKKVHHKTKHKKFMIGLPIIIFFHTIIISLIFYKAALF